MVLARSKLVLVFALLVIEKTGVSANMDDSELEDSSHITLLIVETCASTNKNDSRFKPLEDGWQAHHSETSLDKKNLKVRGIVKGNFVAIKNIVQNSATRFNDDEDWQKLINLSNDHVIVYYDGAVNDPLR